MTIVESTLIPSVDTITDVPLDDPVKIYKTCLAMQELCDKENGIGLSAVQVGIPWRLFLVKGDGTCPFIPKGQYGYFANCEYKPLTEETVVSLEGCLSLRSEDGCLRSFQVKRFKEIRVIGFRLNIDDFFAFIVVDYPLPYNEEGIVFQHEIDHDFGQDRLISKIGRELFLW